jgi:hypothetical protein
MIEAWRDNSGSLARRILIIYFRKFIKKENSDPKLYQKLMDELPDIQQKANRAYLQAVKVYGDKDIWSCIPKEFIDWNEEAMESSNDLIAFLKCNDLITMDPDKYCYFQDFKDCFKLWCWRESREHGKHMIWSRVKFYYLND